MSALRILALSYLASASVFIMAAGWASHPELAHAIGDGVARLTRTVDDTLLRPGLDAARRQDALLLDSLDRDAPRARIAIAPPLPGEERLLPHTPMTPLPPRDVQATDDRVAQVDDGAVQATYAASASVTIAPLPDLSPEAQYVPPLPSIAKPVEPKLISPSAPRAAMPNFDVAREEAPKNFRIPDPPSVLAPRAQAAALKLRASLTPEMVQNFGIFIFVSKAEKGPLAQRMYVFRNDGDRLTLLHDWAASTGREKDEISPRGRSSFTSTPAGFYQFDPDRIYRKYHSFNWDQDMPHALFFNWERQGYKTGLAIHSAVNGDIAKLGQRASAGCVHLSPENAATLFQLIKTYRGPTPRFAYNGDTQTMSNKGGFMHTAGGKLKMADGFRVLVDIEDYSGREVVASLN